MSPRGTAHGADALFLVPQLDGSVSGNFARSADQPVTCSDQAIRENAFRGSLLNRALYLFTGPKAHRPWSIRMVDPLLCMDGRDGEAPRVVDVRGRYPWPVGSRANFLSQTRWTGPFLAESSQNSSFCPLYVPWAAFLGAIRAGCGSTADKTRYFGSSELKMDRSSESAARC